MHSEPLQTVAARERTVGGATVGARGQVQLDCTPRSCLQSVTRFSDGARAHLNQKSAPSLEGTGQEVGDAPDRRQGQVARCD